MIVVAVVVSLVYVLIRRRVRSRSVACEGRMCIGCGYELLPESDGAPCPECGTMVDLNVCRAEWKKALGE
jgi:predicted RNA-binding Zn-ribbon protein involved in translation (DUF1610 family)